MYGVVADAAERKSSVVSVARMREVMRLEFYQFLFLKKTAGNRNAGAAGARE